MVLARFLANYVFGCFSKGINMSGWAYLRRTLAFWKLFSVHKRGSLGEILKEHLPFAISLPTELG